MRNIRYVEIENFKTFSGLIRVDWDIPPY